MSLSGKETELIRTFVRGQLRDESDLSTLTIRILKSRYLSHVQGDTLSPEAKKFMKKVVQEEILKMQDNDSSQSEVENQRAQKKRKRTNELLSKEEDEFVAKKSRQSPSLSESKDKADGITTDEENKTDAQSHSGSDNRKQVMKKSQRWSQTQESSEESIDEDEKGIEMGKNGGDSPEEVEKCKENTIKDSGTAGKIPSREKETTQSDKDSNEDDRGDVSEKSGKTKKETSSSSDESDKENPPEKKIKDETDSDSSSLPSLEDEEDKRRGIAQEKNKMEKKHSARAKKSDKGGQRDEHKSVVRLKRFIRLCGVRKNYKKLLHGCRSVRSQVAVLKKELEDLGVHGKPSVGRCKKIRMKREEAQELAELDVNNIISSQGRPKRKGASVRQEQQEPPSTTYACALKSDSDGDEENKTNPGCRRTKDWSNLQGIISDDADSD